MTRADPADATAPGSGRPGGLGRLLRVVAVGGVAGLVSSVAVEQLLLGVVRLAVRDGEHPVLALLVAGAVVYPVVVLTLLGTSLAAWGALRLLHVPRAVTVAGVSGLLLAGTACAVISQGVGYGGHWVASAAGATVHGAVWLLVGGRHRRPGRSPDPAALRP